ncbi:pyridoxal phosphate-dependent aminotransferase [Oharaeibacter diazotrophicus]|uniref:aspartate transaminase n=1 Tax=Oharaeibacter diazotrophicus TaxID=1920512 RepID=A0A4R6RH81_9HYPH|nr:pyridoxal phosphate-dependent aminotransferase [Oharaeibacter diazotrophicus]TDP85187.1 aspartate/methionine/tyrosine aminotransferase [Oharaeibacter diazotrophicus]BBE74157.1 aspartate aminotransferase [Pleomorphomonas sp. SM30]GLS76155.1 aminotransferase [Oharaeibacter diazotrophicus]
MSQTDRLLSSLTADARGAPPSGIVEVMRHGHGKPGIVPLWAGEGDLPTPAFVHEAAARSLAAGETFYTLQTGLPEFRAALAAYHDRVYGPLFGRPFEPARFLVTGGGMHAIQLAVTAIAGPGDEVLVPTPAWPNFAAAVGIRGARPVEVPMRFGNDGFTLDLDDLAAAITPATRAIFVNSPSNPTGWTADAATLAAILELSRRHGLWIVADEVYGRFHYVEGRPVAPSFHHLIDEDDRVIFVNTFSKNWAMTGWRIGWIEVPTALSETIQNLIQYSSSGTAVFMQRAAIAALGDGDGFLAEQVARARTGRDIVAGALEASGRVRFSRPEGAFYLFFSIDGEPDVRRLGLRLVDEANVGLAPGTAFGHAGAGFMRLCFARGSANLQIAAERLKVWLDNGRSMG